MSAKLSTGLKQHRMDVGSTASALTSGFIHVFDGPVPASADDALSGNALLVKIAASTDGLTGLTFDAAVGGVLPKKASETWDGLIGASGTPTFFRFCAAGDDGTAASTTAKRWQDTAGGPGSGAAVVFTDPNFVANGSNRKGLAIFELREAD